MNTYIYSLFSSISYTWKHSMQISVIRWILYIQHNFIHKLLTVSLTFTCLVQTVSSDSMKLEIFPSFFLKRKSLMDSKGIIPKYHHCMVTCNLFVKSSGSWVPPLDYMIVKQNTTQYYMKTLPTTAPLSSLHLKAHRDDSSTYLIPNHELFPQHSQDHVLPAAGGQSLP